MLWFDGKSISNVYVSFKKAGLFKKIAVKEGPSFIITNFYEKSFFSAPCWKTWAKCCVVDIHIKNNHFRIFEHKKNCK